MGPHRIIHNHKGYLTETVFDAARGVFTERAFPPPVDATPHTALTLPAPPRRQSDIALPVRDAPDPQA